MTTKRSFAAITGAAAVAIFGSVAAASEAQPASGFDWMANGAQTVAGPIGLKRPGLPSARPAS